MGAANPRGLGRIAARVSILTMAAQGCSFASSIVIAHVLGATRATDAYFLGLSIPLLVYGIFLSVVRLGAIPSLTTEANAGPAAFVEASGELISATLVATVGLSLLATGVAIAILPLADGGSGIVSAAQLNALELAPLGVFGALIAALASVLAVRNRFAAAAVVLAFDPILRVVLLLAASRALGTHALVFANLSGNAIAVLVMWALVVRAGIPLRIRWPKLSPFVRGVVAVSLPILICAVLLQMNPVIDRTMAATLGAGSITALELGLRLFAIPMTLIGATLIGPLTATWSARKAEGGWPALRDSVNHAIEAFSFVLPPVLVLGIVLHHELVGVMYQGGAYSAHATGETAAVFVMFLVGLPAQLLTIAFSTLFVVEKQTMFLLKTGGVNVISNVVLNFALRAAIGISGIALSTSLTYTIILAGYVIAARRRWEGVRIPFFGPGLSRTLIGAGAMTLVAIGISSTFPSSAGRTRLLAEVVVVSLAVLAVQVATLLTGHRGRSVARNLLRQLPLGGLFTTPTDQVQQG